ncbi:peptidylprolyl isomerase [Ferruginibacter albus]|uniref:peptidylprolyl isomerase n=1 Tax=Ferruginibacter albus TaxID=2875540 RepID=UPI001CC47B3E|nr:peptidylprolyl isomerase [Ferruginibacter albus]UAY51371.1 peptidyl-prolyl cis-trans isomerase [Ferruginibacter albus]
MNKLFLSLFLLCCCNFANAQSIAQMKKVLDTTSDPIGYVKYVLKKKYTIDTISISSTTSFAGVADSLAYKGKQGKTYGPYTGRRGKYLVKILTKVPNTFYHVSHILLDTSVFRVKFANSLADTIIAKIQAGSSSFAAMASTYSSDNLSAAKGGDLGWFSRGAMLPQLDRAIAMHKKGDIFKVWTRAGLHIVSITDSPKEDVGFALILKVTL